MPGKISRSAAFPRSLRRQAFHRTGSARGLRRQAFRKAVPAKGQLIIGRPEAPAPKLLLHGPHRGSKKPEHALCLIGVPRRIFQYIAAVALGGLAKRQGKAEIPIRVGNLRPIQTVAQKPLPETLKRIMDDIAHVESGKTKFRALPQPQSVPDKLRKFTGGEFFEARGGIGQDLAVKRAGRRPPDSVLRLPFRRRRKERVQSKAFHGISSEKRIELEKGRVRANIRETGKTLHQKGVGI